ncbi:polyprenyl synthetase family protein [Streptomyces sp. 6N223]|uniref:polyprenyl synthetase family protein n=1 Tax=Streptomyces sp. 6N223 TaxID=3457412 RepID=UPI003FD0729F
MPTTASPPQALDRCRDLVRPALVAALERLHPDIRRLAAYSFGWCAADGTPAPDPGGAAGGGKGVRQAFAILAAEAVGSDAEAAVPAAVAAELVHAFSLVHDDIMDNDARRRHRPSLWKAFGTGPAVLAGDALLALAVDVTRRSAGEDGGRCRNAMALLCAALMGLMRGQAEDMHFERRPWCGPGAVKPEEYRAMAANKTGALFGCSAALGTLLAGGDARAVAAFDAAGRHFGIAFQSVDDLLGIWGDPRVTGKPVGSDLRRGKKTLPMVAALAGGGGVAERLADLLEEADMSRDEKVGLAARLVERAGGRRLVLAEGRRAVVRAHAALDGVPLRPRPRQELGALCEFVVNRVL